MEKLFPSLPEEKKLILEDMMNVIKEVVEDKHDHSTDPLTEWKGYKFIPLFEAETAKRAYEQMEVEENTVFICSFPKTGSNWTFEIVKKILYGGDEKQEALADLVPHPLQVLGMWKPEKLDLLEDIPLHPKSFFSHLPEELLNLEKIKKSKGKLIVVLRNPKDQAASWFHFSKGKNFDAVRSELSEDWAQFFSDSIQGKHRLITKPGEGYLEYIQGYYKHKNDDNFFFFHFEDMKKNPQKEIAKLADFLEVKLTEERIRAIAEATSFESMKKAQDSKGDDLAKMRSSVSLIRKGQVGSWKSTFTVAQSELMDKLVEEKLGHFNIKFIYE